MEDYVAMRLTLRKHPMAFLREKLSGPLPPPHAGEPRKASPAPGGLTRADAWESREGGGRPLSASTRH